MVSLRRRWWITFFVLLSGLFNPAAAFAQKDTLNASFKFPTIVIDPGHGGKDPGARGTFSLEKNVALAIGKKLRTALQETIPDVKVMMTRTDDSFIELNRRSEIANENHANLFISIHCNSSPEGVRNNTHKQIGALVLVYGLHRQQEQLEAVGENTAIYQENNYKEKYKGLDETDPANYIILNAYMHKYRMQSILFSTLLINEFKDRDQRQVIGVKEQGVYVLANSGMPAVLIETGFINNPVEEKYLNSDRGQDEIVQSVVRSIKQYRKDIGAGPR
jgi:N-acetylmuramoyl-L-alanine amidase